MKTLFEVNQIGSAITDTPLLHHHTYGPLYRSSAKLIRFMPTPHRAKGWSLRVPSTPLSPRQPRFLFVFLGLGVHLRFPPHLTSPRRSWLGVTVPHARSVAGFHRITTWCAGHTKNLVCTKLFCIAIYLLYV